LAAVGRRRKQVPDSPSGSTASVADAASRACRRVTGRTEITTAPVAKVDTQGMKANDQPQVAVTPSAVVFSLTPELSEKARQCLEKSGEIRISFEEVSVTNLSELRELGRDGVLVD
jgi:hypothetical protein